MQFPTMRGVENGVNKRSAMLVAAGLAFSLATGFVAFLNGGLGLPAHVATRPSPALHRREHVEASAQRGPDTAGTALLDRRTAGSARNGGSSNDD
jgi:hypothetical protein